MLPRPDSAAASFPSSSLPSRADAPGSGRPRQVAPGMSRSRNVETARQTFSSGPHLEYS
jgi:hypothetical protein